MERRVEGGQETVRGRDGDIFNIMGRQRVRNAFGIFRYGYKHFKNVHMQRLTQLTPL